MAGEQEERIKELEQEQNATQQQLDNATEENNKWRNTMESIRQRAKEEIEVAREEGVQIGRHRILEENRQWDKDQKSKNSMKIPIKKPKIFILGADNYKTFLNTFKIFVTAAKIPEEYIIDTLLTFLDSKSQRRTGTLNLTETKKREVETCYERIGEVLGFASSKVARFAFLFRPLPR